MGFKTHLRNTHVLKSCCAQPCNRQLWSTVDTPHTIQSYSNKAKLGHRRPKNRQQGSLQLLTSYCNSDACCLAQTALELQHHVCDGYSLQNEAAPTSAQIGMLFKLVIADFHLSFLEEGLISTSGTPNEVNEGAQMLQSAAQLGELTDNGYSMRDLWSESRFVANGLTTLWLGVRKRLPHGTTCHRRWKDPSPLR